MNALPVRSMVHAVSLCVAAAMFISGCGGADKGRDPVISPDLEAGIAKLRENDFAGALTILEKAARDTPLNASVQCNLGVACWKLGRTDQAVEALQKAAGSNGSDARPLEFLGQVLMDADDWEGARDALAEAHERVSNSPRILTALAVAEIRSGKDGMARLEQALTVQPDYAPALYDMAVALHNHAASLPKSSAQARQSDQRAAEYCRQYLDVMDLRSDAHTTPGTAPRMATARKLLATLTSARISTTTPPPTQPQPVKQPSALLQRARRAVEQHAYEAALILLKQAIREDPEDADALWTLVVVYGKRLKYPDKAAETYKQFRAKFPDDPRAALPAREQRAP